MLLTVLTVLVLSLDTIFIFIGIGKESKKLHRHLVIILFVGISHLLFGYMSSFFYSQWLYLILSFPLGLLYGPVFLLLVNDLGITKGNLSFWKHLIPFFLTCIFFIFLTLNSSLRYQYHFEYSIFLHFLTLVQMVGYVIILWPLIVSYVAKLPKGMLRKELWFGTFFVMLILLLQSVWNIVENKSNINHHREMMVMLYMFFIFSISFLLFACGRATWREQSQAEVRDVVQCHLFSLPRESKKRTSARKTNLMTKEQEVGYRKRIENFIETLAFLDADMNKEKFCRLVEIPSSHVASFLKQEFDRGFNGFINQLRLNYAARQLKSDHLIYTIEDLSLICGFSSRASFYRNFQTEFGCSPHQFRFEKKSVI
ncbi:helix-turn-helix transcriptional regulator [Sphingobacterium anhuiense]|uniref:Helix-turn-helix transcriptional regulator n=1 Tax=Sphingobacterium anhuiense TaxID=493780 RepID=A0ABW5YYW9_9SPHI